jgi:hypothetical protein
VCFLLALFHLGIVLGAPFGEFFHGGCFIKQA